MSETQWYFKTNSDVTFRLINNHPAQYKLRRFLIQPDRGIGQIYADGIPQASPWTCASSVTTEDDSTTGGLAGETKMKTQAGIHNGKSWKKSRKINGYYSAFKSVFFGNDGNDIPRYNANNCTYYNSLQLTAP